MEGEFNLSCIYCNARIPTELVEMIINNQEVLCERCGYTLTIADFPQLQVRSAPEHLKQHKEKDLVSRIIDKVNSIVEKTEKKQESHYQSPYNASQPYQVNDQQTPYQVNDHQIPYQQYTNQSAGKGDRYNNNTEQPHSNSGSYYNWNKTASHQKEDPYIGKIAYSEPRSILTDSERRTIFGLQKAAHIISNILFSIGFFIALGLTIEYRGQIAVVTPLFYLFACAVSLIIDNLLIYPKYKAGNAHGNLGIDEIILGIATLNVLGFGIPRLLTGLFILALNLDSINRRMVAAKKRSIGAKEAQLFGALSVLRYTISEGNKIALLVIGYAFATILMTNLGAWPQLIFISIFGPIALGIRKKYVVEPVFQTKSFRLVEKNIAMSYVSAVLSMFFGIGFLFLLEALMLSVIKELPKDAIEKFFENAADSQQSSDLKAEYLSPHHHSVPSGASELRVSGRLGTSEEINQGLPFKIRPIESGTRDEGRKGVQVGGPIKRFDPYTGKPLVPENEQPKEDKSQYIADFEQRIYTVLSDKVKYELNQLNIDKEEKSDLLRSFIYLGEEEQLKYIQEIKGSNQSINTDLIERIRNLQIRDDQKESLIQQLDYLSEPEQENFVRYLEASTKGAEA